MYVRYYIIPTDPHPVGFSMAPLDLTTLAGGTKPGEGASGVPSNDEKYYLVKVRRMNEADFAAVEKLVGIIPATKESLVKLATLGVDTAGVSVVSAKEDVEKRISTWLIGKDWDFARLSPLKQNEQIGVAISG